MEEQFKIGSYDFLRYLGKGGMAAVWEARHSHLNKGRLAIKFLLEEYAANQDLQRRFLSEAEIESSLDHPNIVKVKDYFIVDGRSYMVMEYVEPPRGSGETVDLNAHPMNLEGRLQQPPPLTLNEVHTIANGVLGALEHAHGTARRVVHRDVKPSNILLRHDGQAVLTDFGIAKLLSDAPASTLTRVSMGTPDYMSPEQITLASPVDTRSDIYSFGCVLYAMLSGGPPFADKGTTDFNIKYCQVHEAPPPLVPRDPNVPQALRDVVVKCLEKSPASRFQSCAEVSSAITAAIYPPPSSTQERPAERKIDTPVPNLKSRKKTQVEPVPEEIPAPTIRPGTGPITPPSVNPPEEPLIKKIDAPPLPPPASGRWRIAGLFAAVLLVVAVVGYIVFHKFATVAQTPPSPTPQVEQNDSQRGQLDPKTNNNDGKSLSPGDSNPPKQTVVKTRIPKTPDPEECCDGSAACKAARKKADLPPSCFVNNNLSNP